MAKSRMKRSSEIRWPGDNALWTLVESSRDFRIQRTTRTKVKTPIRVLGRIPRTSLATLSPRRIHPRTLAPGLITANKRQDPFLPRTTKQTDQCQMKNDKLHARNESANPSS